MELNGPRGDSDSEACRTPLPTTDAPLQRPTLRLQGNDIILEEGEPTVSSAALLQMTPEVRTLPVPRTPGVSPGTPVPTLDLSQLRQTSSSKAVHSTQVAKPQINVKPISSSGGLGKSNGIGSFR